MTRSFSIYFSSSYLEYNGEDYQEYVNVDKGFNITAPPTFNKCKIKTAYIQLWSSNSGNVSAKYLEILKRFKDSILRQGHETGEIIDF